MKSSMKPSSGLFIIQQISQKCDVLKSTLRFWKKRLDPLFSPRRASQSNAVSKNAKGWIAMKLTLNIKRLAIDNWVKYFNRLILYNNI
jgi:hypothetical protein